MNSLKNKLILSFLMLISFDTMAQLNGVYKWIDNKDEWKIEITFDSNNKFRYSSIEPERTHSFGGTFVTLSREDQVGYGDYYIKDSILFLEFHQYHNKDSNLINIKKGRNESLFDSVVYDFNIKNLNSNNQNFATILIIDSCNKPIELNPNEKGFASITLPKKRSLKRIAFYGYKERSGYENEFRFNTRYLLNNSNHYIINVTLSDSNTTEYLETEKYIFRIIDNSYDKLILKYQDPQYGKDILIFLKEL